MTDSESPAHDHVIEGSIVKVAGGAKVCNISTDCPCNSRKDGTTRDHYHCLLCPWANVALGRAQAHAQSHTVDRDEVRGGPAGRALNIYLRVRKSLFPGKITPL